MYRMFFCLLKQHCQWIQHELPVEDLYLLYTYFIFIILIFSKNSTAVTQWGSVLITLYCLSIIIIMKDLMIFDIYYIINCLIIIIASFINYFILDFINFVFYINQLFLPFPLFPYKALTPAEHPQPAWQPFKDCSCFVVSNFVLPAE